MTSTYQKGTRVWLPDSLTGWVAGTVSTVTLPVDPMPTASVTIVITLDSDDSQSRTLTFPFSLLEKAGNDIQPTSPVPGQDSLPPLRNPPLLESSEDLASLSNLNEPSGEYYAALH
jgi:myosin-5